MAEPPIGRGTETLNAGRAGVRHTRRSASVIVLGAGDPLARRVTRALIASGHDVTNRPLNDLLAQITGQRTLHPLYPRFPAADRDLLQRSHRLDVTSATGWNPRFGRSALAFVPSS